MRGLAADRVGIGWRPELAASILTNTDQIDLIEVIADDLVNQPPLKIRAIETLSKQIDVIFHGVTLGLASTHPVCATRLSGIARVLEKLNATSWSEHLAFVRAGGIEIGHLAAPPRTQATIDGACENLGRVARVTGRRPIVENIATLINPPGSKMSEPEWITRILRAGQAGLLLDLHNLYANALNFGEEPAEYLLKFPLEYVEQIHLSGGHWIHEPGAYARQPGAQRLLDDHVHDVPAPIYDLLSMVASVVRRPLTVVIERDGNYPDFEVLLNQVRLTRRALAKGRIRLNSEALVERAIV